MRTPGGWFQSGGRAGNEVSQGGGEIFHFSNEGTAQKLTVAA